METESSQYAAGMRQAEQRLLDFLRVIEAHLEGLHIHRLAEQNTQLKDRLGVTVEALQADLALFSPPEPLQEFHTKFSRAVQHCADAYAFLLRFTGQEFAMDFLKGRYEFCRGNIYCTNCVPGCPFSNSTGFSRMSWPLSRPWKYRHRTWTSRSASSAKNERSNGQPIPYMCLRITPHTPNGRSLSASTAATVGRTIIC